MAQTKIKAGLFEGIIGNGTDGYFLMSNGDGTMTWSSIIINPTVTSLAYPGSVTAADPDGGETITMTGTGFKTGATVTVGGTAAPVVSYVSETQITFTTPAKAAGDYDIVFTNTDTGSATYINGISYNGIPSWTTAAGSLGTFASAETISTITLAATEPDGGTITFNITNGALPTGLSLTGANIDGTTSLETAETLYTFTVTATDNESQTTPRVFTITVKKQFIATENFTINTYTGNGSTQSIEGKIGTAASFNGSSSYISGVPPLTNSNASFTISMWFKTSVSPSEQYLFGEIRENGTYDPLFQIWLNGSGFLITEFRNNSSSNSGVVLTDSTNYCDGNWHHVVSILTATQMKMYIDGNEASSSPSSISGVSDVNNCFIGARNNRGSLNSPFNGTIDQVRIFNKALSSSEVTTLYGESNTSTTKSTTDIFDDGSGIALYEFEEGAKDTGGVSGKFGSGFLSFGESGDQYIDLPDALSRNQSQTLSAWIYPVTQSLDKGTAIKLSEDDNMVISYNTSGQFEIVGVRDSSDTYTSFTNVTKSAGQWYHIVIARNASQIKLYIDNSLIEIISWSGNLYSVGGQPYGNRIGQNNLASQSFTRKFAGRVDDVRVYSDELTSTEVGYIYNNTTASIPTDNLIAYYKLDGDANDTGPDGGFSNHGYIRSLQNANYFDTNVDQLQTQTISFWAKIATTTGGNRSLLDTRNSSGESGILLRTTLNNNELEFSDYATSSNNNTGTWSSTESDLYKHFLIILESTQARIYENNVLKATVSAASANIQNGGDIYFGDNPLSSVISSDAYIEYKQIRTYARALSDTDRTALYNEDFTDLNVISTPESWFTFDNNSSGSVNDKTGSYTGNISGMAYTAASNYDGTPTNVSYAYNGTPTNVSFVGTSFQPDLVWIKARTNPSSGIYHTLMDSVRGKSNGYFKSLFSNSADSEDNIGGSSYTQAVYGGVTSFDINGFTLDDGSAANNDLNVSSTPYVAWMWKAGGTAVSNTDGSITSSVSANQDAGFSIVKYEGTQTGGSTVGHGLISAPEIIIAKNLDNGTLDWRCGSNYIGWTHYMNLNSNSQAYPATSIWNDTAPTNSVFTLGSNNAANGSGNNHIAYCFHSVDGYQKVGSYNGNGTSASSINTITTGFKPRWVMFKCTSAADQWIIFDSQRGVVQNVTDTYLLANLSQDEQDLNNGDSLEFLSNGLKITGDGRYFNLNNETYIYLAIA